IRSLLQNTECDLHACDGRAKLVSNICEKSLLTPYEAGELRAHTVDRRGKLADLVSSLDIQTSLELPFSDLAGCRCHLRNGMGQTANQRQPDNDKYNRERQCERQPRLRIKEELICDKRVRH